MINPQRQIVSKQSAVHYGTLLGSFITEGGQYTSMRSSVSLWLSPFSLFIVDPLILRFPRIKNLRFLGTCADNLKLSQAPHRNLNQRAYPMRHYLTIRCMKRSRHLLISLRRESFGVNDPDELF